MSDAQGPGPQQQVSEEELRQYLGELRQAPAAEVIAQVIQVLANAAQVKLGRNDARVLIDAIEAVRSAADEVLPHELTSQIDDVLTQLRMAQVEGEKEVARLKAEGGDAAPGATEPTPGRSAPTAPGQAAPSAPPQAGQQQDGSPGSRLWTPGSG